MKKSFLLGEPGSVHVDIQRLIDTRLLIQANSGGGKSWCLRRILEQTHGAVQHLVIDPEGEFSSLRERFDYVLAAKAGGDTAADVRSARLLAERLLGLGVSAILDIYELKHAERISFVKEFLDALVNAPKKLWHPALIVVDEAHVFCPEKGEAESAGAVIDLATRGRKRGFCAVLATQRLAKLAKDAAAECNNKLIGRTGLDVDVKRAADELGFGKDRWQDFRKLPEGSFFAYGPAISRSVVCVQVGGILTSHPKAGARLAFAAPPPTDKVRALLPKLADLPAESEQRKRTEDEMRREISGLKRELVAKAKSSETQELQKKIAQLERERTAAYYKSEPKRVEVPVLGEKQIDRLGKTFGALREDLDRYESRIAGRFGAVTKALSDVAAALAKVGRNGHETPKRTPQSRNAGNLSSQGGANLRALPSRGPKPAGSLPRAKQKILDALAFLEEMGIQRAEKTQLALMAGVSPTSGGYFNNLGSMRTEGLIEYPAPNSVSLTESGRASADSSGAPATTEELHAQIRGRLPAAKWKIVEELVRSYPDARTKDELAEALGVSPTSGGYFNNLGSLRSLGLISYPSPGQVAALPVLFLEG